MLLTVASRRSAIALSVIRRAVCVVSLAVVIWSTAQPLAEVASADVTWNDHPVLGYARVAPLDRLQRDVTLLTENVGGGESLTVARDKLKDLAGCLDATRPAGVVVYLDESVVPMLFFPVKDLELLFVWLREQFGWQFHLGDDGLYRGANVDATARLNENWLYVTGPKHREHLKQVPADPTAVFAGVDPAMTAQVRVNVAAIPLEMRSLAGGAMAAAFATSASAADGLDFAPVGRVVQRLLAETEALDVELQCFRPLNQLHVTTRFHAADGSDFRDWLARAAERPLLFEHLTSDKSFLTFITSLALDPESTQSLTAAWEPLAAKARAAGPSPRAGNATQRALGQLISQTMDAVTKTLAQGELDFSLVCEKQGRDQLLMLAGTTLQGARAIEEKGSDLIMESPELRALDWSTGGNEFSTFHNLRLPASDETVTKLFGDPLLATFGFTTDRVYLAFGGEEAFEQLANATARAQEETPAQGELLRLTLRLAPLLAVLSQLPGKDPEADRQVREFAESIAPHRKNDTLELSCHAADDALENRLRVDLGIVRALARQIPTEGVAPPANTDRPDAAGRIRPPVGAANLALRLRRGERFQVLFHTATDMTTTVDGEERPEQSTHALLFDFRVLNVAADGAMQVEASLNRATIEKDSPEGPSAFDTQDPPESDKMTPEMLLHGLLVNRKFTITLQPDGTIVKFAGLKEAVEEVLDKELKPAAAERTQARTFVEQILNEPGLRDTLTRAFEFLPSDQVKAGDRWTRTVENFTGINFLLENRYQLRSLTDGEATIGVKSQVDAKEQGGGQQPVQWDVVGTQTGTLTVDPRSGRLRLAEYILRTEAEATLEVDGQRVTRPVTAVITMTVGEPATVARQTAPAP